MKTVIEMAREAGMVVVEDQYSLLPFLERFAALVIANHPPQSYMTWQEGFEAGKQAEREACAKVCDSISEDQWALYKGRPPYTGKELERASEYTQGKSDGAEVCAAAIRARGNT